jgi:hypothetical protein
MILYGIMKQERVQILTRCCSSEETLMCLYLLLLIARVLTCCSLVATQRVSKSKNIIQGKCVACGSRFQFDDTHAVGNFIKKNPPTDEHSIATKYARGAPYASNGVRLLATWLDFRTRCTRECRPFFSRAVLLSGLCKYTIGACFSFVQERDCGDGD